MIKKTKKQIQSVLLLIAAFTLAACGGGGGAPAPAPAQPTQLQALSLTGGQEVPAVATAGSGSVTMAVSADRSQIDVTLTVVNLSSLTTAAHVHFGGPGVDGPIILNIALAEFSSPLVKTLTAADLVPQAAQGINTFADAVNAILAGNTYVNVHTQNNPDGEIRGALGSSGLQSALSGANEVPAVATAASGTADLSLNDLQTRIDYTLTLAGTFTSPITQAHIHAGAAGTNGPVILFLCTNLAAPAGVPAPPACPASPGSVTGALTSANFIAAGGLTSFADAVNAILSGNAYVNVHTQTNPDGEIRGPLAATAGPGPGPGPAPAADIFNWIGNTTLNVPAALGLLANDPAGTQILDPGAKATSAGGTVTISADGSFIYEPQIGDQNITDTFTYTATGNETVNVSIVLTERAWYVRNNFADVSDGSNDAPFTTLAAATVVGDAGDTIFVFSGDGTATGQNLGITLQTGQKLIGEGVGLTFAVTAGNALTIVPAGLVPPVLANTTVQAGAAVVVTLSNNNEVAGIEISGAGAAGNILGFQGVGVAGFNIHDNVIDGLNREGILLTNASGTGTISGNTFSNLTGAGGNAVDYITNSAGVNLGISGNTFSNVAETGIRVRFDAGGGAVSVTGNTLTGVGANAGRRGIDVDASGTSVVASTISGNVVGSAAGTRIDRAGIQVNGSLSGTHRAAILNNTVENAGADGSSGVEAQAGAATSSVCVQMNGNSSTLNGGTGYTLDNRAVGTLQVEGSQATLEAGNTGIFTYLPAVGSITFVPAGTCSQ